MEKPQPSVRAASWSAAQCVRHFCSVREISHPDIEAFCQHLEDAVTAESVVAWDAQVERLRITGLGDPLPIPLDSVQGLGELLTAAREVTATQLYAAWSPLIVAKYLSEAASRSGLSPDAVLARAITLHHPDEHGWGPAASPAERDRWSREA
ncbi:hypothetical protein GCM10027431_27010 [Lysobacter rhizosphaerae]